MSLNEHWKTNPVHWHLWVRHWVDVIIQKLRQDVPGQLGMFCRKLSDANVNNLTQYSDHSNQLIVVVDDFETGKQLSEQWMKAWS